MNYINLENKIFIFNAIYEGVGCYNLSVELNTDELILKSFAFKEKGFELNFKEGTNLNKYAFLQKINIDNKHYFQVNDNKLELIFEDKYEFRGLYIEFYKI